jgi:hypothetical protein
MESAQPVVTVFDALSSETKSQRAGTRYQRGQDRSAPAAQQKGLLPKKQRTSEAAAEKKYPFGSIRFGCNAFLREQQS